MRRPLQLRVAVPTLLVLAAIASTAQAQLAGSHDNKAPIEITANNLTVRQKDNLAIFQGDVDAVQGDTSLKADELRVSYSEQDEQQPAAAGAGNQNVRRIEAEGNVLLARPGETASGERGVYDVPAGKVTLIGNVVLTSKDNVIRGARLDYDLNTGVASLAPAATGDAGRSQRVRALFQSQPKRDR